MVDLLEMDRLKGSGSMEQRLASLEKQVGFGPGQCFWGTDPRAWLWGLAPGNHQEEVGNVGHLFLMGRAPSFPSGKLCPSPLAGLQHTALRGTT